MLKTTKILWDLRKNVLFKYTTNLTINRKTLTQSETIIAGEFYGRIAGPRPFILFRS